MELLYWLESVRIPVLDVFMSLVTRLGEKAFFIIGILFVFWCVDKRKGYYLLSVFFVGMLANRWLKIILRVPRPWVQDPNFTVVESARRAAGSYSFPSGHTQIAAGFFGCAARLTNQLWLRIVCITALLLVAVSRMYLGVHTPADVGASLLLSAVLVFVMYPLIESTLWFPNRIYIILGVIFAANLAFVVFMEFYPFPADVDSAHLIETLENAYSMAGAVGGALLVSVFDNLFLHFPTRAPWWGQAVKLLAGLALVRLVSRLSRDPLLALCGGHEAAHAIQYFLMALTAGCLWPMTFRFFERYNQ